MLKKMTLKKFTAFSDVELEFGRALNIIVGENGFGKSHILKAAYSVCAVSAEARKKHTSLTKSGLQNSITEKLIGVFRPDTLGRLTQRKQGRERSDVSVLFEDSKLNLSFSFSSNSKSEVTIKKMPTKFLDIAPAFFPTRELLTLYPNFVAMYEGHYLEFEETWRDLCILLGQPLQKGPKELKSRSLLSPLEKAMGGEVVLDKSGRFYLKMAGLGLLEMPLVAEGVRKFAMVARLISNGTLLDKGVLFWDEPEANLNPKLIKEIAKTIVDIARSGIQLFIATHSLFLLRELEIILAEKPLAYGYVRYFGFTEKESQVAAVMQGSSIEDIGDITSLTEDLKQSDRFLEVNNADNVK